MLEDIRGHSPIPDPQELQWIAAQPFRQLLRVAALALVAFVLGNASEFLQAVPAATITAAAPVSR